MERSQLEFDLEILEWLLSPRASLSWRSDDHSPGVFAKKHGISLRLVGSELSRTVLTLRNEDGDEYRIWDPQPMTQAPAGRLITKIKNWINPPPPEAPKEPTIEEKLHWKLNELNRLAVKDALAKILDPEAPVSVQQKIFRQLRYGKNSP